MRLRAMMACDGRRTDSVLGTAWDQALEVYRDGGDGEVTWLESGSWLVCLLARRSTPTRRNARLLAQLP